MIRLSAELFVRKAKHSCTIGSRTEQVLASWCFPRGASELDDDADLPTPSWDAALVHHCGFWSHYDAHSRQSSFPLVPGTTIAELAWYAEWRGVQDEYPVAGDIFLQYSLRRRRFVHVGIVEAVQRMGRFNAREPYYDLTTIEGDTTSKRLANSARVPSLRTAAKATLALHAAA